MSALSATLFQLQYTPATLPIYRYFREALAEGHNDHYYYTKIKQLVRSPDALGIHQEKQLAKLAGTLIKLIKLYWKNHAKESASYQSFLDLLETLPSTHPKLKPHMARFITRHPVLKKLCQTACPRALRDNHDNLLSFLSIHGHRLSRDVHERILQMLTRFYSKRSDLYTSHIHQTFIKAYVDAKVQYHHSVKKVS